MNSTGRYLYVSRMNISSLHEGSTFVVRIERCDFGGNGQRINADAAGLSGGKPRPTAGFCLTHRMRASTMAVGCFCLFSPRNTCSQQS